MQDVTKKLRKQKACILSIDGGGIRGVLPGTILQYIEEGLSKAIGKQAYLADYFDLIAGTSTGGILSILYMVENEDGRPKFTATDAVNLYLEKGGDIFSLSFKKKLRALKGLLDEKYDANALEKALDAYLDKGTLADLGTPSLITAYDMERRAAMFFNSKDAWSNPYKNFYLRDVARATSAAPTYFEPVQINSLKGTPYALLDGGVFANNPAMCAYAEARSTDFSITSENPAKPAFPGAKDMLIVSLGTGTVEKAYPYKDFKDAGMAKWIKPMIDILMSGSSETVDYHIAKMYGTLRGKNKHDYYRIEPDLLHASTEMDDAGSQNLQDLSEAGANYITENSDKLDEIVAKLLQNNRQ